MGKVLARNATPETTDMMRFTVHTIESAPAESRPLLAGIQNAFGFVPNLYAVFAESPAALKGALAIGEAFSHSAFSPLEQELVSLTVSEANGCRFCVAAHSTLGKRAAKAGAELVAATRARATLPDAKLDVLVTFTRKVVEQRGVVTHDDLAAFFGAGYTQAQLMELLLGVGMKTFNNYVDLIARVPLNDQFKAEAWDGKRSAA